MTIEKVLETKTASQMHILFVEAEQLRKTGVINVDAEIRKVALAVFGENNALQLKLVCTEVYRQLAIDAIASWQRKGFPS